ncbi:tyrosine-type recombinase/integrase [Sorangium sp. So ce260]|uniref:tyrosine-type recombinase/integrase n=1 Tax=Sorangium sp. So ce260 TaxID=3133291 RepID=UPI003F600DF6
MHDLRPRSCRARGGARQAEACHTLRHRFATQLLQAGTDIRTIQIVFGHKDVRFTTACTHIVDRGHRGVISHQGR